MRKTGLLLLLACSLLSCRRLAERVSAEAEQAAKPAKAEPLDQSYPSKNGLITIHYPASFAAKTVGKSVVVVSKNLGDGTDEAAAFVSIENPISDEVNEFARVVDHAEVEKLTGYQEKIKKQATCNGAPGVEVYGSWVSESGGTKIARHSCYFIKNGHGYAFSFSIPEKHEAVQEPVFQSIVDATEFHK